MTKAPNRLASLLHRRGVTGPARVRAFRGTGAPFAFLLVLGVLALTSSVASANAPHGFEGTTLGSGHGEGAGQLELVAPVLSSGGGPEVRIAGSGVAVNDKTHDVYVADTGNHRVSEFEADGTFLRTFGRGVNKNALEPNVCGGLEECQKGMEGSEPGELSAPKLVAVDQSSGDVYVGDGVGTEATDELQWVEFSGGGPNGLPTGGTYTLTVDGETTKEIAYLEDECEPTSGVEGCPENDGPDAKAAQQKLEELPSLRGNIRVGELHDGRHSETTGLKVTFVGALAETVVPTLTADPSNLTPSGAIIEVKVESEGSKFAGEVISKFTAEGALIKSWGDSADGQLTGKNASEGPFAGRLGGLAVDSNGDLWVLSTGGTGFTQESGTIIYVSYLFEFEEDGAYKAPTLRQEASASGLAVDEAGNLYVVNNLSGCVEELGHGCISGTHDPDPTGFALDQATGHVFAGLGSSIENADSSCVPQSNCEVFGSPQLKGGAGVAVDASTNEPPLSGTVYAANTVADVVDVFPSLFSAETEPASEVTVSGMTLHGTVDPEGSEIGECYFEYGTSGESEHAEECEESPKAIGRGVSEVPVQAQVTGLRGGTTYHFRLVAARGARVIRGVERTAATPTVPVIADAEAVNVAAGSTELRATVDPEGIPVSRCEFEYGTSTAYGHAVRCEQALAQIGYGTAPVPVSARITGLEADTTYHWRLRVQDANGPAYAADHTFVYPTVSAELPDNREYEMVSPVVKNGASLGDVFGGPAYQIAEDGSRVVVQSVQCFGGLSCTANRRDNGEPFEFNRTATGWVTTALAPPATFSANSFYQFGPETGLGLFSMPTPPGGEDDWYKREADGSFVDVGPTTSPAFGLTNVESEIGSVVATADLSHIVWQVNPVGSIAKDITEEWPFLGASGKQVVEYAGAGNTQPFPVGVNDEGKLLGCETDVGNSSSASEAWNAMSADGRIVYFSTYDSLSKGAACEQSYARVDGGEAEAHTVALATPACEAGQIGASECEEAAAHPSASVFAGASADGSRAFFLDTQQLTDDATEGTGTAAGKGCSNGGAANQCNLYLSECFAECETSQEQRRLIDVSAGDTSGIGPQVQGVVAISADGSHVYFVANGVLTKAANDEGQRATPGNCRSAAEDKTESLRCNMYVYDAATGRTSFIASVPSTDVGNWEGERYANVTPEGRFLVFESHGALTPDDTRTNGYTQIFRYDADQTAQEESENVPALVRISIGDEGYNDDGDAGAGPATIVHPSESTHTYFQAGPQRGDPTMSNDGSYVFFESPIGLTAHALDDVVTGYTTNSEGENIVPLEPLYAENVYEWHEGHVYLISDGRDVNEAKVPCPGTYISATCLLGTDATGRNVFFTTADQLVPADTDTQIDIYDARICESGSPCIQPAPAPLPPCIGEQCHGIPAATPSLLAPGTATFNGEGNVTPTPAITVKPKALTRAQKLADALKACAKDKKKSKRKSCEATARKKYGAVKKSSKKKGK